MHGLWLRLMLSETFLLCIGSYYFSVMNVQRIFVKILSQCI